MSSDIKKQLEADRRSLRFEIIVAYGIVAAVVGFAAYALKVSQETQHRFMTQCMQDHKEYECTAMWRAGDNSGGAPTVLLIPTGR